MTTNWLDLLKELIEGGFIGQALIGTLVWGIIAYLLLTNAAIDQRLYDAGFVVIGYLFHMAQTAANSRSNAHVNRLLDDCNERETPE